MSESENEVVIVDELPKDVPVIHRGQLYRGRLSQSIYFGALYKGETILVNLNTGHAQGAKSSLSIDPIQSGSTIKVTTRRIR